MQYTKILLKWFHLAFLALKYFARFWHSSAGFGVQVGVWGRDYTPSYIQ